MQPAEIFDLVEGDRQQWNRIATLGAWIAWFVSMSMPRLSSSHSWRDECQRFETFLEKFPPPDYRPELKAESKEKRRRR